MIFISLSIIVIYNILFVSCFDSIESTGRYVGQRHCYCELFVKNAYHNDINFFDLTWQKGDNSICYSSDASTCYNQCRDKINSFLRNTQICNYVSESEKENFPSFRLYARKKYSSCEGFKDVSFDFSSIVCPSACKCSLSKILDSKTEEILNNKISFQPEYNADASNFHNRCSDFCENEKNKILPAHYGDQDRMNFLCSNHSGQLVNNGYKLDFKKEMGNWKHIITIADKVCCNPVCDCDIKFKKNSDNSNLNDVWKVNVNITHSGYICNTFQPKCMKDCRVNAAKELSSKELENSDFGTPDLNIFINPVNNRSSTAAYEVCDFLDRDVPKPGYGSYIRYDMKLGGFPSTESLFLGNICCLYNEDNDILMPIKCNVKGKQITFD